MSATRHFHTHPYALHSWNPVTFASCLEGIQYYHRPEVAQLELLLRSRKRQKLTKRQAIEYAIGAVQKRAKVVHIDTVNLLSRLIARQQFVRELLEWALRQEAERMREIAHMRSVRASQYVCGFRARSGELTVGQRTE